MGRGTIGVAVISSLVVGLVVGALAFGSDPEAPDSGASVESVVFAADAGNKEPTTILELAGLTMRGYCQEIHLGQVPHLTITAETAVEDAFAAVNFGQERGSQYTFAQSEFDPAYGEWDILGEGPSDTTGTFVYSNPDGGEVSLTFVADEGSPRSDCFFGGTAVSSD